MAKGIVYLVGAGPGDPGLITIKGAEVLKKADVVVYDYLSNDKLLDMCPHKSEKIYVGKKAGCHTMKQEDINCLLVEKAKEDKQVVRLKGGDPYVFGRGGEEAEFLCENDIEFEVIPGVTSALAGLAYAGIPATYRNESRSFHVMTGHDSKGYTLWDWQALSKLKGTLIFLMAIGCLESILSSLVEGGKDLQTPAAVIMWATYPHQKTVVGTLKTLSQKAKESCIEPPGLIVIGDVVEKKSLLEKFEKRPLHGKRIVVTRAQNQQSHLGKILSSWGAEALEVPTIQIEPCPSKFWDINPIDIESFTWIAFTSVNGVSSFMEGLFAIGKDVRILKNCKIAAIGKATAQTLKGYGLVADLVPKRAISETMAKEMKETLDLDDRLIIIKGNLASNFIEKELRKICFVKTQVVYKTSVSHDSALRLEKALKRGVDAVVFTSASTVKNFHELLESSGLSWPDVPCFSIGPKTSQVLNRQTKRGVEAPEISIDSLAQTIRQNFELGRKND